MLCGATVYKHGRHVAIQLAIITIIIIDGLNGGGGGGGGGVGDDVRASGFVCKGIKKELNGPLNEFK